MAVLLEEADPSAAAAAGARGGHDGIVPLVVLVLVFDARFQVGLRLLNHTAKGRVEGQAEGQAGGAWHVFCRES